MGYVDCDKAAMGRFVTLKEDKETARFLIVGEPEVHRTTSSWGMNTRFLFPVIFDGELKVYPCNKTQYSDLKQFRDKFDNHAVIVTRHGKPNSKKTTYVFELEPDTAEDTKSREDLFEADVAEMFEILATPF